MNDGADAIDALDLEAIRRKLVMPPEAGGYGWPEPETDDAIIRYRRFLKAVRVRRRGSDPEAGAGPLAPDPVTDVVWHTHILFSEKYHRDCAALFGEYIHHRPVVDDAGGEEQRRRDAGGAGGPPAAFDLARYLEDHEPLASATNLDAVFAAPERAGTLLEASENLPGAVVADIARGLSAFAFNRYPVNDGEALQGEIRRWLNLPEACGVLPGNGGLDLIDLAFQSLGAGATALTLDPDFFMYDRCAGKYGVALHKQAIADGFAMETDGMARRIEAVAPDLVLFSNPHNPTSAAFPPHAVEALVRQAPGLVLVDEVYAPFARAPDALLPLLGRYPNLLILRSFSKIGAAAIRFGFLLGHRDVLARIGAWQNSFAVGGLAMLAARAIIRHNADVAAALGRAVGNRDDMIRDLTRLPGVAVYPSSTNFIIVRLLQDDARTVHRDLAGRGVGVLYMGQAPGLDNCLRFSVDTPAANGHAVEQLGRALSRRPAAGV